MSIRTALNTAGASPRVSLSAEAPDAESGASRRSARALHGTAPAPALTRTERLPRYARRPDRWLARTSAPPAPCGRSKAVRLPGDVRQAVRAPAASRPAKEIGRA